jgi:hypothetical protein
VANADTIAVPWPTPSTSASPAPRLSPTVANAVAVAVPCIKPLGYSHKPSVLQIFSFWLFLAFLILMHTVKYQLAQRKAVSGGRKEAIAAMAQRPS